MTTFQYICISENIYGKGRGQRVTKWWKLVCDTKGANKFLILEGRREVPKDWPEPTVLGDLKKTRMPRPCFEYLRPALDRQN
jgi:hypothetical protein